jgi:uncharacterized RDD family membrane protein YckC
MVTKEMIDYIDRARKVGKSDQDIRAALTTAGWAEEDINAAFSPNPPQAVNYAAGSASGEQNQIANVRYAGFWIRFVASIIDGIILFIPSMFLGILAVALGGGNEIVSLTKTFATVVIGGIYIYIIYRYQASPGKMALGLKIVSDNFERMTLGQVLLREIVGKFVSSLILYIGYIMIGFTAKKQGLHDMIAKTVVVHKN